MIQRTYDIFSDTTTWDLVVASHRKGGAWFKNYRKNTPIRRNKANAIISNMDIMREYMILVKPND